MAFNKQAPEWGAIGIEPPESKRNIGWEVEDRPPAAWLNWFMNLTAESLQELQSKAAEKTYVEGKIAEAIAGIDLDIPDASLTVKGITQLNSAVDSTSETQAATPKAVKSVNDTVAAHLVEYEQNTTSAERTATINAGTQVIQGGKAPAIAFPKVEGRTLINLIGNRGGFERIDGSLVRYLVDVNLDSAIKKYGNNSLKITMISSAGMGSTGFRPIKYSKGKFYIILADVKNGTLSGTQGIAIQSVDISDMVALNFGNNSNTTTFQTAATKFTTAVDLAGSAEVVGSGKVGEYFFVDGMRVYEVTEAEYKLLDGMTGEQLGMKYPYVGAGIHGVTNPTFISVQGNLLPAFGGWQISIAGNSKMDIISPYTAKVISFGESNYAQAGISIPIIPGKSYTLGGTIDKAAGVPDSLFMYWADSNSVRFSTETQGMRKFKGTHVAPEGAFYAQVFFTVDARKDSQTLTNPTLMEGDTPLPFKPQSRTSLTAYTKLFSNPDGSVKDTLEYVSGRPQKTLSFGSVVLDASLAWRYNNSAKGITRVGAPIPYPGIPFTEGKTWATDYSGELMVTGTTYDTVPKIPNTITMWSTDNQIDKIPHVYLDISSRDSGWGDLYIPTADEIKAYFMGWVMVRQETWNTTPEPYSMVGSKGWVRRYIGVGTPAPLASQVGEFVNGSGASVLPTSNNPYAWTPYNLLYQLANQVVEKVQTSGAIVLEPGDNYVIASSTKVPMIPGVLTYADSMYTVIADLEKAIEPFIDSRLANTDQVNVFTKSQIITNGGNSFALKAGAGQLTVEDHVYLSMYPRSADPDKRGMWLGFGGSGDKRLTLANDIGDIMFGTQEGEKITFNGHEMWHNRNSPASIGTSGYQKLANGLLIQWGVIFGVPANTLTRSIYPIAWATGVSVITATVESQDVVSVSVFNPIISDFQVKHNGGNALNVRWIAIGT
ncbi:tail fiber protein [Paenibacillus macquariensis]|uniref:Phage tail fibre repeat-containing protein n=1 Tax=Paenibacillus macquariensis TaxID=948756 RepID=A0ABY1JSH7_9BACL|nr:phage tail protein [Paenibacillus macquariensis]MEC0092923.1 phage tail protein [Paenibacillus macquariensis]OAB36290.1 hypothetical protein PMSM_07535 [Paenibacillus macquariensis subsp. macquariensis]SIQ68822.1 Phage tail fibre repeat-containing protein [Paenibacillus macquariensis]